MRLRLNIVRRNTIGFRSRPALRSKMLWLSLLLVATQPGCQMFNQFRARPTANVPIAFTQTPTKEQLVTHLLTQTEKVKQLQTDIRVSVDGLPNLRGNLVVEKPDRLRLNAGLLGVTELGIDVGSNEDVFWFWAKAAAAGNEPAIYYARHNEYRNSALQTAIPIEPAWLIDALGLLKVEPTDRIEGPFPNDGRLELRTYRMVGNQKTLRKTIIDPKFGWIVQQSIYDATGKLLAYADSRNHQHYPEHNVNLPSQIEITAVNPDGTKLALVVNASRFKINSIYGDPQQLWSMPNPGDVPLINLVGGVPTTAPLIAEMSANPSPRIRGHRTSSNILTRNKTFVDNIR